MQCGESVLHKDKEIEGRSGIFYVSISDRHRAQLLISQIFNFDFYSIFFSEYSQKSVL